MKSRITVLCILILLLDFPASLSAESSKVKPHDWGVEQGADIPILDEEMEDVLDEVQRDTSELLFQAADWIDSFFENKRTVAEKNMSRATVSLSVGYSENDDFEVKPRADIRLRLPKLAQRTQLIITSSEDSDFNIEDDPVSNRPRNEDTEENDWTAALRFFLRESERMNISFDTGASWNYLYGSLRYRSVQDFDSWLGRFTNRLRWYTDDGWENKTTYDIERPLADDLFFRATSSASLFEGTAGVPHSQHFRLFQVWSSLQAVSYETGVYLDTRPSYKVTDIQCIVKYRQRFYRDWLVLEISPRITFPDEHDRDPNPGIIIKFEAAIGYKADEEGYRKVFR